MKAITIKQPWATLIAYQIKGEVILIDVPEKIEVGQKIINLDCC